MRFVGASNHHLAARLGQYGPPLSDWTRRRDFLDHGNRKPAGAMRSRERCYFVHVLHSSLLQELYYRFQSPTGTRIMKSTPLRQLCFADSFQFGFVSYRYMIAG